MPESDAELLAGFWRLAAAWRLTLPEQMAIAGVERTTLYAWRQAQPEPLDPHLAARLSGLLAVEAALRSRLGQPERAHEWLRKPHPGSLMNGRPPLQRLLDGSSGALCAVSSLIDMTG